MTSYDDVPVADIRIVRAVTVNRSNVFLRLERGDGSPVVFETPSMKLAWTVGTRTDAYGVESRVLPMSFCRHDGEAYTFDEDIFKFRCWMQALRSRIKVLLSDEPPSWFTRLGAEEMESRLAPMVKGPTPDSGFPTVFLPRLPVMIAGKVLETEAESRLYSDDGLRKGERVKALITVPYVYVPHTRSRITLCMNVTRFEIQPVTDRERS